MNKKSLTVFLMFLVSFVLSQMVLKTPSMKNDESEFSGKNALEHIQEISKEPHSVFDYEAHENVRKYIIETAGSFVGSDNVTERNYRSKANVQPADGITFIREHDFEVDYDVRNVVVEIEGKNKIGMLLVAHYDSRGHVGNDGQLGGSYGAADDGYGVATLLELIRLLSTKELENSVYFLFADAEETKMMGSKLEAQNTDLMNKVNFVLNVEARGVKGASYMFETSKNNNKVLELYEEANYPTTYSVATAVYTVMPNYTDFTSFLEIGKPGVNFAVLDSLDYYHNPKDNYENVSPSSVQHYGEQILPMVLEYTSNAKYADMNYFIGTHDMIFFNLFSNLLIKYSETTGLILTIILILGFIGLMVYAYRKNTFNLRTYGKQFAILGIMLLIAVLSGYLVSQYLSITNGIKWNLTNVNTKYAFAYFIGFMALMITFISIYLKRKNKEEDNNHFIYAGITINLVLSLITNIALSGASFMFFVPALIAVLVLVVRMFVNNKVAMQVAYAVMILINMFLFVPLIYSLYLAVTIGGLLALALLAYLPLTILIPNVINQLQD